MPKIKRPKITETTISMLVRVEPDVRDALDEIAANGGMSRDQMLRATFRGMIDAWREVQSSMQANPSLFAELNQRVDAAISRAAETAVNPPTARMRTSASAAMKASGIKPRSTKARKGKAR